jgi:DNA repair exonuclease SbcCD ATPase subunit
MKTKLGVVILVVACGGLAIALFVTKKTADERLKTDTYAILDFSNQLVAATANLDELRQVNLTLTNDLAGSRQDLAGSRQEALTFSNQFTETSGQLASAKASLQSAQDQIASLNGRIAGLETQNQVLDQRAAALTNAIASLNEQIADTEQKLAGSETNNTFLEKELQRQTAAKAELESKFNNLTIVRAQVKKLKGDLFVARRLQWMREDSDPGKQQKGAQLLVQRTAPATNAARPPHYDLNVEVSSDGSIHVVPLPASAPATATNLPPP